MKAHDYFTMGGQDMNEAYNMFKEAIELEKKTLTTLYYKSSWMQLPVK